MIWELTDKLYWGDMDAPLAVEEHGVKSLICVAEELCVVPFIKMPTLKIPLPNGQPIPNSEQFFLAMMIMHFTISHPPVTIYCRGGTNRSAGSALLYLTVCLNITKEEAWNKIKALKPDALDWSKDYTKIVELGE